MQKSWYFFFYQWQRSWIRARRQYNALLRGLMRCRSIKNVSCWFDLCCRQKEVFLFLQMCLIDSKSSAQTRTSSNKSHRCRMNNGIRMTRAAIRKCSWCWLWAAECILEASFWGLLLLLLVRLSRRKKEPPNTSASLSALSTSVIG